MLDLLLVAAVLVAGLACPALMWWQHRRGGTVACCPPRRSRTASLEALHERQAAVSKRIAELEGETRGADSSFFGGGSPRRLFDRGK
jgi:hypothetical protein